MALTRMSYWLIALNFSVALCYGGQPGVAARDRDPGQPIVDPAKQAIERQNRINIAKSYAEEKKKAESTYISSLSGTIRWLATMSAQAEARKLVQEIKTVNATHADLKDMEKLTDGIKEPKALEAGKEKELETRLKSARRLRAEAFIRVAGICYGANLMGYAYDLVGDILNTDPDNSTAWSVMGRTKTDKGWRTKFEMDQDRANNVYLKGFGWVGKANTERIEKGEWFENGKWMPMAEADKLHNRMETPWIIETDNFTLKSSASRKEAIKISERLEAIRQLCYRRYLEFFTRGSSKKTGTSATSLLFNHPAEKKMLVHYFGSNQEFIDYAKKTSSGEMVLRSAGFYSHKLHASYFYYEKNYGKFLITVTQHEVTHQVLGEFSHGGGPTWVTEGVAAVLEHADFVNGKLTMPAGYDVPDVITAARLLKAGKLPSVNKMLTMEHEEFHKEPDRGMHYKISSAICCFLLEYKDGQYAADFLEYLYDAYVYRNANLNDYFGMSNDELDKEFRAYLQRGEAEFAKHAQVASSKTKNPDDDGYDEEDNNGGMGEMDEASKAKMAEVMKMIQEAQEKGEMDEATKKKIGELLRQIQEAQMEGPKAPKKSEEPKKTDGPKKPDEPKKPEGPKKTDEPKKPDDKSKSSSK